MHCLIHFLHLYSYVFGFSRDWKQRRHHPNSPITRYHPSTDHFRISLFCTCVAGDGNMNFSSCRSEWLNEVCWFGLAAAHRKTPASSQLLQGLLAKCAPTKSFTPFLPLLSFFDTFLLPLPSFSGSHFLPLRFHLRLFVFSLLAYNPFPPFLPSAFLLSSSIHPPPLLLLLYFSRCVCVWQCLRHV